MKKEERIICEAIDTYLQDEASLGLQELPDDKKQEEEHSFQYLHEHINDLFATKAADLIHYDGVCAAFRKVHNYKYVTDPNFWVAVEKELTAQAVPKEERNKVQELIPKIIEEVSKDTDEQDAGFNPNLEEILDTCRNFNESTKHQVMSEFFKFGDDDDEKDDDDKDDDAEDDDDDDEANESIRRGGAIAEFDLGSSDNPPPWVDDDDEDDDDAEEEEDDD